MFVRREKERDEKIVIFPKYVIKLFALDSISPFFIHAILKNLLSPYKKKFSATENENEERLCDKDGRNYGNCWKTMREARIVTMVYNECGAAIKRKA
jgi:hypothetical protein